MYEDRIIPLITRIQSYQFWDVVTELVVLWLIVYLVVRFLRGTHGARVAKGIALMLVVVTVAIHLFGPEEKYERLAVLYDKFVNFAALTLVIVFQPELRRALVRLGQARIFRGGTLRTAEVIDEIVGAMSYLSRNKIGALIAIERQVGLETAVVGGTPLDARVSRDLLNTIFWPGSALHDMAVLIREDRIVAGGVQLPLAEGERFSTELGSRHRAAIGLTQETDAFVLIVSEETGIISVAERGKLTRGLNTDELHDALAKALGQQRPPGRVGPSSPPVDDAAVVPAVKAKPPAAVVEDKEEATRAA